MALSSPSNIARSKLDQKNKKLYNDNEVLKQNLRTNNQRNHQQTHLHERISEFVIERGKMDLTPKGSEPENGVDARANNHKNQHQTRTENRVVQP